jgi:hypothetical protein
MSPFRSSMLPGEPSPMPANVFPLTDFSDRSDLVDDVADFERGQVALEFFDDPTFGVDDGRHGVRAAKIDADRILHPFPPRDVHQ